MFRMAIDTVLVSAIFVVTLNFVRSAPQPTLTPLLESLCSQAVSAVPNDYPREVYLCAEKSGMTTEQLEGINLTSIDVDDKVNSSYSFSNIILNNSIPVHKIIQLF